MGRAALLCLLLVFTLHLNIFNFQRVNVGVSLGFRRVSEGFPEVSCKFSWVSAGFPKGFRHFVRILMVFAWVSAWFPLSFAGFVQFSICGRFSEVSAGFLGCNFVWKVCRSSSQQKLEKSYHDRCAALRQILYLCRDHFWSQKKMEFCYRFEGDLHGCHKCVLQLKERVVKKVRVAF